MENNHRALKWHEDPSMGALISGIIFGIAAIVTLLLVIYLVVPILSDGLNGSSPILPDQPTILDFPMGRYIVSGLLLALAVGFSFFSRTFFRISKQLEEEQK